MSDPIKPIPPTPSAAPQKPARPEVAEDAGFQALTEALGSSFVIVKVIMVILVIVFLGSGFFTVASQERAIVLRFGKPVGIGDERLLQPGAHWSFPYPIDEVVRIPFSLIQTAKSTAGWHNPNADPSLPGTLNLNPELDGYTLTSDGNLLHILATMNYRISDPLDYALNFVSASNAVVNILDNAIFYASEYFTIDDGRTNKAAIAEMITKRVEALVQEHGLGIKVDPVLIEAKPPLYLNTFFENVATAEQQRGLTNQSARAFATTLASKTQGDTNTVINAGLSEKNRLILEISSELNAFTNQLPFYRKNPSYWMDRSRMETALRAFTNANQSRWLIDQRFDDVRMQLNEQPEAPKASARTTGQ